MISCSAHTLIFILGVTNPQQKLEKDSSIFSPPELPLFFSAGPIWVKKLISQKNGMWVLKTWKSFLILSILDRENAQNVTKNDWIRPNCQILALFGRFLSLLSSKLKTDFCIVTSISSFKFLVPTCHTFEKLIFLTYIGPAEKNKGNSSGEKMLESFSNFFLWVRDT